ncbi:MAG: B12-binding domain-containing radical SAM protein [Spirochaetota bacterium]
MVPNIVCIQPPVYDFALYDLFFKPYGILRIAAHLRSQGYDVEFINGLDYHDAETGAVLGFPRRKSNGTGKFHRQPAQLPAGVQGITRRYSRYGILPEVFTRRIAAARPDLVLITSQMTYWYPGVAEAVRTVRSTHPSVPLVVGGIYATLMPEHCKASTGADEVIVGDGIRQLPRILSKYRLNSAGGAATDADHRVPGLFGGKEIWADAGVVRLNAGCPYHCTYCASKIIEPRFQAGDYRMVWDQIQAMHRRFGTANFAFYDDALLVHKEELLLPLLEEIIRSKLPLRFYTPNAVHMHYIDRETAKLMRAAGFQEVRLGYESADESFHLAQDGKYTSDEVPAAIRALKQAGFPNRSIILYVLAGLPRQRAADVQRTLNAVASFGVRVSIAEYSPVPQTALWPESVAAARVPIAQEPLYHNNTFFPMEWEGFTRGNLEALKRSTASV